jgi:hypothetical protein|tara:strand:+ start:1466 stop:1696 length:231 start_codon:yes stop_codon:yes gene_type:complete
MTVKDAIKCLQQNYKLDEELIVAWWDKTFFEDVTEEKWKEAVEVVDHRMDWSSTHEDIDFCIKFHLKESKEEVSKE